MGFFSDVIFVLLHLCTILSFGHGEAIQGLTFPPQSQKGAGKPIDMKSYIFYNYDRRKGRSDAAIAENAPIAVLQEYKGIIGRGLAHMGAKEVLEHMAKTLLKYVEELKNAKANDADGFRYGERTAYTECLEMIQRWEGAKQAGLDFEIEQKYPL